MNGVHVVPAILLELPDDLEEQVVAAVAGADLVHVAGAREKVDVPPSPPATGPQGDCLADQVILCVELVKAVKSFAIHVDEHVRS